MEFRVLGQPLLIELLVLLLEGFHAALEMNLQPLTIADRKESHTLRHAVTSATGLGLTRVKRDNESIEKGK